MGTKDLWGRSTLQEIFPSLFHLTFGDQLLTSRWTPSVASENNVVNADRTPNYSLTGKEEDFFQDRALKKMFNLSLLLSIEILLHCQLELTVPMEV